MEKTSLTLITVALCISATAFLLTEYVAIATLLAAIAMLLTTAAALGRLLQPVESLVDQVTTPALPDAS